MAVQNGYSGLNIWFQYLQLWFQGKHYTQEWSQIKIFLTLMYIEMLRDGSHFSCFVIECVQKRWPLSIFFNIPPLEIEQIQALFTLLNILQSRSFQNLSHAMKRFSRSQIYKIYSSQHWEVQMLTADVCVWLFQIRKISRLFVTSSAFLRVVKNHRKRNNKGKK